VKKLPTKEGDCALKSKTRSKRSLRFVSVGSFCSAQAWKKKEPLAQKNPITLEGKKDRSLNSLAQSLLGKNNGLLTKEGGGADSGCTFHRAWVKKKLVTFAIGKQFLIREYYGEKKKN